MANYDRINSNKRLETDSGNFPIDAVSGGIASIHVQDIIIEYEK